jgi:hypothetical protein
MVTSGVANWFWHNGLEISQSIVTYQSSSGMSVSGLTVQRKNLVIICILMSKTPSGITTDIERSAVATQREQSAKCRQDMFTDNSTYFDTFPVLCTTSLILTSFIHCSSACWFTTRSGYFTVWRRTNRWQSIMQSCNRGLLISTSHRKESHMKKFVNQMEKRSRKWVGIEWEL